LLSFFIARPSDGDAGDAGDAVEGQDRAAKRAQQDELRRKKKEMFDKDYDLKDNTEYYDDMKQVGTARVGAARMAMAWRRTGESNVACVRPGSSYWIFPL
jgi:hypothetical protein